MAGIEIPNKDLRVCRTTVTGFALLLPSLLLPCCTRSADIGLACDLLGGLERVDDVQAAVPQVRCEPLGVGDRGGYAGGIHAAGGL